MNWKVKGIAAAGAIVAALGIGWTGLCCGSAQENDTELSATSKSVELEVEGISCASCTLAIRAALRKLDGVESVNGGETKARLVVQYEPAKVSPRQIVETVSAAGFPAKVIAG